MNHVIVIHGRPDKEEYFDDSMPKPHQAHWLPWLKEQLEARGIATDIPEMPKPYEPDYEEWKKVFETYTITPETTLVGHSRGGGFLLRYFSEHPELHPKKIILVAPWIDPEPHELDTGFFDFTIDSSLAQRTNLVVFYSTDDEEVCVKSAEIILEALPNATYHKFDNKGHFTKDDLGTEEFPELLEEILK